MVDAALLYCFTANYSSCILSTHVPSSYGIHRKLISQHTKLTHKPNIEGKKIMAKPSLATISFFLLQGQIAKKVTVTSIMQQSIKSLKP